MAWIYWSTPTLVGDGEIHPRMAWIYWWMPTLVGAGKIHPRMAWIYCRAEPMLGCFSIGKPSMGSALQERYPRQ
ncbi:hypothetical protein, partial [Stenotrophomonas sp. YIM B13575]|uniref:hypothetical protein n=1 Tax=Stenotrophomonas sp. YIM B13575 TaxID=3366314 RepID=UPI0036A16EC1